MGRRLLRATRPAGAAHDERGSVTVEFVLVFVLLATVLFMTLDAGQLLHQQLVITMTAREGARRAAISGGDYPVVREHMQQLVETAKLDPKKLTIAISPRRARYGTILTVDVGYPYRPRTPLLRGIAGKEVTLRAQVVTRSERLAERSPDS